MGDDKKPQPQPSSEQTSPKPTSGMPITKGLNPKDIQKAVLPTDGIPLTESKK